MRINARLDPGYSRKLSWLVENTGNGVIAVITKAIDLYYLKAYRQQNNAFGIFEETGFVGGEEGDPYLSTTYKADLSRVLDAEHGNR